MAEVQTPLSNDEYTVLSIAYQGESMIDLGEFSRWSAPIQSLVRRGLLIQHGKFNNTITPAGRAALEAREKDEDKILGRMIEVSGQIAEAQSHIRGMVSQVADALVAIGAAAGTVTGEDPRIALRKWAAVATDEAVKRVQEGQHGGTNEGRVQLPRRSDRA